MFTTQPVLVHPLNWFGIDRLGVMNLFFYITKQASLARWSMLPLIVFKVYQLHVRTLTQLSAFFFKVHFCSVEHSSLRQDEKPTVLVCISSLLLLEHGLDQHFQATVHFPLSSAVD